jgi:hypothetical protein
MPKLVSVRPVGFRPTPYDWVPLAVIILLIVIFVGVYSGGGRSRGRVRTGPGGGLCAVPVACQNEAGTTDIERHPDGDRTGRDQGCGS